MPSIHTGFIETSQYWEPEVQRTRPGRNLGPHRALTAPSSELTSESPKEGDSGVPCGGQGQFGLLDQGNEPVLQGRAIVNDKAKKDHC